MPSIANQDFKIYGLFEDSVHGPQGIPGIVCGELYAALVRANDSKSQCALVDSFALDSDTTPTRMVSPGVFFNPADEEWVVLSPSKYSAPAYYDALWAIQQAAYAIGEILSEPEFLIHSSGKFQEGSGGFFFVNEDGYFIKGTVDGDGKLASLYLGE
ncbi:MAG: hypothetical protein J6T35_04570, partial [Bacteroidales bacterium]|nr:hypothetical protein [Bacteroidales bacterium]